MVSAFTLRDLLYAAIRHTTMFETEKKKPPLRFATIEAFLFIFHFIHKFPVITIADCSVEKYAILTEQKKLFINSSTATFFLSMSTPCTLRNTIPHSIIELKILLIILHIYNVRHPLEVLCSLI